MSEKPQYFVDYLSGLPDADRDILGLLEYELARVLYHYGEHFKFSRERRNDFRGILELLCKDIFITCKALTPPPPAAAKSVFSNAYFSFNSELRKLGYSVSCPSWWMSRDRNVLTDLPLYLQSRYIKSVLTNGDFHTMISPDFFDRIKNFRECLRSFFLARDVRAVIVPTDLTFFERLTLQIFKQIKRPSFIFLHGLPAVYDPGIDNRSDFLLVWGEKIKENFVAAGFDPSKVFVVGHPLYQKPAGGELRFSLEKVLVLSKALSGAPVKSEFRLTDRANCLLYLFSLQNALKRMGVRSAILRLHPSDNPRWYARHIDTSFYTFDNQRLDASLRGSSLVVGPASTVLLEAGYAGVNYTVFEPSFNGMDLTANRIAPPFDGSDRRIPVAQTEDHLCDILAERSGIDAACFASYIKTPFDLTAVSRQIG